jgi:hypothetical protein
MFLPLSQVYSFPRFGSGNRGSRSLAKLKHHNVIIGLHCLQGEGPCNAKDIYLMGSIGHLLQQLGAYDFRQGRG